MRHTRILRGISAAVLSLSGQLLAQTTRYSTTQFADDALNRLTKATYASGTSTVMEFAGGRLHRAQRLL